MTQGARVIASMWWCGDPVCDCTQPVVERIAKRTDGPGYNIERLWEGLFVSRGGGAPEPGEVEQQWRELREAAERFGAEKGWRPEDEVK